MINRELSDRITELLQTEPVESLESVKFRDMVRVTGTIKSYEFETNELKQVRPWTGQVTLNVELPNGEEVWMQSYYQGETGQSQANSFTKFVESRKVSQNPVEFFFLLSSKNRRPIHYANEGDMTFVKLAGTSTYLRRVYCPLETLINHHLPLLNHGI